MATSLSVRRYRRGDYRQFSEWCALHQSQGWPEEAMPELGAVVEDDAGPCLMLFLFLDVGGRVAMADMLVARPGNAPADTRAAASMAVTYLSGVAKGAGFLGLIAYLKEPLAKEAEKLGFQTDPTSYRMSVKSLR